MSWIDKIEEMQFSGSFVKNILISKLSCIKMGGVLRLLAYPRNQSDLKELLQFIRFYRVPVYVLGNASNVLFPDEGWPGIIISLKHFDKKILFDDNCLTVIGDIRLEKLIHICMDKNMTGFEFLVGIPAYVMASIFCNAGVQKSAICDLISELYYMDLDGQSHCLSRECFDTAYRKGPLNQFGIIYQATFELSFDDREVIQKKILNRWNYRKKTQPFHSYSLGCVFKNPVNISAGQLIDELGFKGQSIGGISVSQRHANFFLNTGKGSCRDFHNLIDKVREEAQKKRGIALELEIQVVKVLI